MSWATPFKHIVLIGVLAVFAQATPANAYVTLFKQSIAEHASEDPALAEFYRERDFAPLWMGAGAEQRRAAFLWALDSAADHGLPLHRYDPAQIRAAFAAADSEAERGALDVRMSQMFLDYAADVSGGILEPRRIDEGLQIKKPNLDPLLELRVFAQSDPFQHVKSLWPTAPMYTRLLREKLRLEGVRARGGWGAAVPAASLEQGDSGPAVAALRNRLTRMGYLKRSAVQRYDADLAAAVRTFQVDHGLTPDGQAGKATMAQINTAIEARLAQILVALERQRWMNKPLGERHILVNISEFRAYVVDHGKVTFDTRVVTGMNTADRRTPEFSDQMTHMVINPTWNVPRSIATKEYLPELKQGGARHLTLYRGGRVVSRDSVDFSQYTASNFPFDLKQAPSVNNALGIVKFMFPNQHNIYLHDTPSKHLFARDVRAFSHGCVRVARPQELAYHLLQSQVADPVAEFHRIKDTGRETQVDLQAPIEVHIVDWSTWVTPEGRLNFRDDPYGRDAKILAGLRAAGVELRGFDS